VVFVGITRQKRHFGDAAFALVGNAEPENIGIELTHLRQIFNEQSDMTDLHARDIAHDSRPRVFSFQSFILPQEINPVPAD